MRITLTEEEKKIVVQALEGCLSELRVEISHTDKYEYRSMLKHRRTVIEKALKLFGKN